jgi:uncharacterized protein YbjQ (UPF0145 family)
MGDAIVPEHPGDRQGAAQVSVPAMPVIRESEKYQSSIPFPLVDGLPHMIGWQWRPHAGELPVFVLLSRGRMGGYRVVNRFPLTQGGWATAWHSLAETDAAAAGKVADALAARAVDDARLGRPEPDTQPVLIVTTNEVPGYRITQVHGDVFGLIVRARNYFSNLGASFRTLAGGEVSGYTRLLTDSRNQARERMWREARARGANAVVAMRFDCNEIGDIMSEVAAYGTAVTVEPIQAQSAAATPGTG